MAHLIQDGTHRLLLTIVEVAQVAGVEEEVCSEKIPEAALARSEGQRCVEVQAACPVGLAAQVVTWSPTGHSRRVNCK